MEHFFSAKSSGDLRSDAHQSQIIGGGADEELQFKTNFTSTKQTRIFSHVKLLKRHLQDG